MTTLEKCIRAATVEHKNWKQELNKFLRQYRATPHSTTDISPCDSLNQRNLKTTLPEFASPAPASQQIVPETESGRERRRTEEEDKGVCRPKARCKREQDQVGRYSSSQATKDQQAKYPVQSSTSCS